jgi:hypothetical protein
MPTEAANNVPTWIWRKLYKFGNEQAISCSNEDGVAVVRNSGSYPNSFVLNRCSRGALSPRE